MINLGDKTIYEGAAKIHVPSGVFYNPYAKFSRSLGVLVVTLEGFRRGKSLVVGDMMAATGVRGIRYFLESGQVSELWSNDVSRVATEAIKLNTSINYVNARVFNMDLRHLLFSEAMYNLDFVDIDPFGTPSPYIDAAVSAVKNRGVVAITATDLTALCGLYPSAAFRKYSSIIKKTWFCHEVALRVLIKSILDSAGRHNRFIEPILSVFSEQYARVYVRVVEGRVKYPYDKIGYIVYKAGEYLESVPMVEVGDGAGLEKGSVVIGPMWIGPLHDLNSVEFMIENKLYDYILDYEDRRRAERFIRLFMQEASMPPYYYDVHVLCSVIGRSPPPLDIIIARLSENGYKVSRTHISPHGLKTDCSLRDFLALLRELPK